LQVLPCKNLADAAAWLNGDLEIQPATMDLSVFFTQHQRYGADFSEVKGQGHVKRALEVTAAGGHNLLMVGPPGSGKTLLARNLPTILPQLSVEEALEVTKVYSVAGLLEPGQSLVAARPFRAPHHTVSSAG